MDKREDYELILNDLKLSQNEDEVVEHITKIIKVFSPDFYKNDLYENTYFKSLIPEIKESVSSELEKIKLSLKEEIRSIEQELIKMNKRGISSVNDKDISKLRDLKKECIILIHELDNRLEDLYFL